MTTFKIIKIQVRDANGGKKMQPRILIKNQAFPLPKPVGYVWREKMIGVGDDYEELRLVRCESIHVIGTSRVRLMGDHAIEFVQQPGESYITDKSMNELSSVQIGSAA